MQLIFSISEISPPTPSPGPRRLTTTPSRPTLSPKGERVWIIEAAELTTNERALTARHSPSANHWPLATVLLVPQRFHGIDLGGPARRDIRGQDCHGGQQQ